MGRRPRSGQGQRSQPVLRAMSVVCPTVSLPMGVLLCLLRSLCVKNSVSVCLDTHTPDRSV